MVEKKEFLDWLQQNETCSHRVMLDTACRARRADSFVEISGSEEEYIGKLKQNEEYSKLSPSVRSQLKRSVKKYFRYLQSKQK